MTPRQEPPWFEVIREVVGSRIVIVVGFCLFMWLLMHVVDNDPNVLHMPDEHQRAAPAQEDR
jgi:hypothetical protein